MPLSSGHRLGPYEIVSRIGAGGMGEVWRARDTRLDRDVAIKILPAMLAADPQFRARFEREAKVVSSLNHPNICTLHDVGNVDRVEYLVMELLDGESLADRLSKGPLPIAQVLSVGIQIASALEKAHRQGVVHRDLKPANVMLTKGGAKLLDFGLAKNQEAVLLSGPSRSVQEPTEHRPLTQEGTILGTFQYMAPEQLDGVEADARTDIFAFGALLYEMATGKRAFEGRTRSSLIAAIVQGRPRPISELQPLTPPALERVIASCLEKDPDDRIQTAHDVLLQLKWIAEGGSEAGIAAPVLEKRKQRDRMKWIAACAAVAIMAALAGWTLRPREQPPSYSFVVPAIDRDYKLAGLAQVSPDGTNLVFRAVSKSDNKARLWLRPLSAIEAAPLADTEGVAGCCIWSPDSRFIGFMRDGSAVKIAAAGGPPQKMFDLPGAFGAAWSSTGTMLVATTEAPLTRVDPGSGVMRTITKLDKSKRETGHMYPEFLPNGKDFLFIANVNDPEKKGDRNRLYAGSLESEHVQFIGEISSAVSYVEPGYLLYVRDGTLLARPFDAGSLKFTGDAQSLLQNIDFNEATAAAAVSTSTNGVLVVRAPGRIGSLLRVSSDGKTTPVPFPGSVQTMSVAPDGKALALGVVDDKTGARDLWIQRLDRQTTERLTFARGWENNPVWSPDGSRLYYNSDRIGHPDLYEKVLDGSSEDRLLLQAPSSQYPYDVSPDGKFLLYDTLENEETGRDTYVLPLEANGKPRAFAKAPGGQSSASFSPDGRHVVYHSNESGAVQVYVKPFPGPGVARQISYERGSRPTWSPDGRKIFFIGSSARVIMSADFDPATGNATEPQKHIDLLMEIDVMKVMPTGDFLVLTYSDESWTAPSRVYVNWQRKLADSK